MNNTEKQLEELAQIRQIMERSTRFLSLSGWSGIFAGIFALLGALAAYLYLGAMQIESETVYETPLYHTAIPFLLADALIVLVSALLAVFFFSWRKALSKGESIWSPVTKRLLFHLAVPLLTGAIIIGLLIFREQYDLVAGFTLVFYGLAVLNAGKYTNPESSWLGIGEILLGLAALAWFGYALILWSLGFGLFHIVYGVVLYYKYDRK